MAGCRGSRRVLTSASTGRRDSRRALTSASTGALRFAGTLDDLVRCSRASRGVSATSLSCFSRGSERCRRRSRTCRRARICPEPDRPSIGRCHRPETVTEWLGAEPRSHLPLRSLAPATVVRYLCRELVGLSGIAIARRPASIRGLSTRFRNLERFVLPHPFMSASMDRESLAAARTQACSSLSADLVPTWSRLGPVAGPGPIPALKVTTNPPTCSSNVGGCNPYRWQILLTHGQA